MEDNKDKALNPTVVKLGIVSFFADVASEMLYPVTPIFLTTVLGASMTSLGMIEGVAEGLASLIKTYSGSWSDRIQKRKPFVLVGYFLGAISKPLIGLSQSWMQVFGSRALDRTGKGFRSAPRDILIADSVIAAKRGEAFGWHRSMDTLGAAVGPLFALLLLSLNSENLRSLYFWALIPGLISVVVVLSVKESAHGTTHTFTHKFRTQDWIHPFKVWGNLNHSFKKYLLACGVFSFTNSSDVFLLMKAKSSGFSISSVILLFCLYNLTYSLSSPYLGKLSDRISRKNILIFGLLIFVLVYLGFGFAYQNWHYWALFLTYGLYMGATEGVGKALAVDLSPASLKATCVGLLGTITGISTIFASLLAGLIWDHFGSFWTFCYGALGAFLTVVILLQSDL